MLFENVSIAQNRRCDLKKKTLIQFTLTIILTFSCLDILFASDYDFSDEGAWGDEMEQQRASGSDFGETDYNIKTRFNENGDKEESWNDEDGTFHIQVTPIVGDITIAGADKEKIRGLEERYLSLNGYNDYSNQQEAEGKKPLDMVQWRVERLKDPIIKKEFQDAGAYTIYAGPGREEVLVNILPSAVTEVDYAAYGIYDQKHLRTGIPLKEALAQMPLMMSEYGSSGSVEIKGAKDYTKEYRPIIRDDGNPVGPCDYATVVEIAPGVFTTARHVIDVGKHSPGDKILLNGQEFTIDKIVTGNNDSAVFTTREIPILEQLAPGDSIPVIPIDKTPLQVGDSLVYYGRPIKDYEGIKLYDALGERALKIRALDAQVHGFYAPQKVPRVEDKFEIDMGGIPGQSGSGIFGQTLFDTARLKGTYYLQGVRTEKQPDESNQLIRESYFIPAKNHYKLLEELIKQDGATPAFQTPDNR